jgi:magnesium-transporting ATPase (P-type)
MDCKIITGDNVHTAAQVAIELKLGSEMCVVNEAGVI